jgi:hypothetical protein
VEHDTRIITSRRPIALEDDEAGDEDPHSITPTVHTRGSQTHRKPNPLVETLEAQFRPFTDPSVPAVIEMVDMEL